MDTHQLSKTCRTGAALLGVAMLLSFSVTEAVKMDLPVCRLPLENLSDRDIKYIQENLFLDDEGYIVAPCRYNGDVYFPRVDWAENGIDVYNRSSSPAIHQDRYPERRQSVRGQAGAQYVLTYGDESYEIEDVDDFRQRVRQESMATAPPSKGGLVPEDMKLLLNIPDDLKLPAMLVNATRQEKEMALKQVHDDLISKVTPLVTIDVQNATGDIVSVLAKQNRFFLTDGNIINQYSITRPSGSAFALFTSRISSVDFLGSYLRFVTDSATSAKHTLDDRLALLEYLKEVDVVGIANKYGNDKFTEMRTLSHDMMENKGRSLYESASAEQKALFEEVLSTANEAIIENEYTSLPEVLTKAQYKSMSDIDKYKYAPEKDGNYTNRNKYVKRSREKVLGMPMEQGR